MSSLFCPTDRNTHASTRQSSTRDLTQLPQICTRKLKTRLDTSRLAPPAKRASALMPYFFDKRSYIQSYFVPRNHYYIQVIHGSAESLTCMQENKVHPPPAPQAARTSKVLDTPRGATLPCSIYRRTSGMNNVVPTRSSNKNQVTNDHTTTGNNGRCNEGLAWQPFWLAIADVRVHPNARPPHARARHTTHKQRRLLSW